MVSDSSPSHARQRCTPWTLPRAEPHNVADSRCRYDLIVLRPSIASRRRRRRRLRAWPQRPPPAPSGPAADAPNTARDSAAEHFPGRNNARAHQGRSGGAGSCRAPLTRDGNRTGIICTLVSLRARNDRARPPWRTSLRLKKTGWANTITTASPGGGWYAILQRPNKPWRYDLSSASDDGRLLSWTVSGPSPAEQGTSAALSAHDSGCSSRRTLPSRFRSPSTAPRCAMPPLAAVGELERTP